MEIVDIEDDVAEVETDYGTYWISFTLDDSGKIADAKIVDFTWADDEYEIPPSDELILQEAIAVIEENLSVEVEEEEVDDEQELLQLIVVARKNGAYSVKLEIDITENERELFSIMNGNPRLLRALRKPLNTLVSSYYRSSAKPDIAYLENLIRAIMSSLSGLWFGSKETTDFSIDNHSFQMQIVEQQTAALWVSSLIFKCTESVSNVMIKNLLRDDVESNFYKMRVQQRSRFDTDRFRAEHPDLYQKYLISSETEVLTKAMNAKNFPLDEIELRKNFEVALNFIGMISSRL